MASPGSASDSTTHVCSYENCGRTFSRPSKLLHHMRVHTAERPYKCKECDRAYTRPAHLRRHIQTNHTSDDETETFRCAIDGCTQLFKNKQNLKKHEQRVHINKPYKCIEDNCDEAFRKKSQLRMHMFSHKGITDPYVCDHEGCGRRFSVTSHLERHKKMHEGYACPEEGCDQVFTLWTLLRKHKAIAHVKSVSCTTCAKTFRSMRFLKRHEQTHAETRDMYMCPEEGCERGYFDLRNLYAHQRTYHGGNRFKCGHDKCGRTFATKQKLQQHMPVHDPNRPIPKKKPRKCKPRRTLISRLTGLPDKEGQAIRLVPLPGPGELVRVETGPPSTTARVRPAGTARSAEGETAGDGEEEEDLMGRGLDPSWSEEEDSEMDVGSDESEELDSSTEHMEEADGQGRQGKDTQDQRCDGDPRVEGNVADATYTQMKNRNFETKIDEFAKPTDLSSEKQDSGVRNSPDNHPVKSVNSSTGTAIRVPN